MDVIFSKILSMSFSAVFVIAGVLLLRLLLKKAPRKYSYFLWLLVFFRLLCPITIESPVSLIPVKEDAILFQSGDAGGRVKIDTGIGALDTLIVRGSARLVETKEGAPLPDLVSKGHGNLTMVLFTGAGILWVLGMLGLMAYGVIQVLRLRYCLRMAVLVSSRDAEDCPIPIYESDYIQTAFLLGLFRPRIYLPLGTGQERSYVVAHEGMHRKRLDHIVKPLCYLAVVLHWFNPLVWLAFSLMNKDMEMSCDEQVLKHAKEDIRSDYSKCLLKLSARESGLSVPLAFGETNTKERIKHALKYKKPSVWIGIGAILVLLIASVTLLTTSGKGGWLGGDSSVMGAWNKPLSEEEFYRFLSENRNPYIGDASANGRLLGILPGLSCYAYDGTQLQTSHEPYELIIRYKKTEPISVREEMENADTMMRNAMYLFATIENMERCTYYLEGDQEAEQHEASYSVYREEMEQIYGPLYERSKTPEGLLQLEEDYQAYQKELEEFLKSTAMSKIDLYDTEYSLVEGAQGAPEEQQNLNDPADIVEALISEAILDYGADSWASGHQVEAHAILGGEYALFQQLIQSDRDMVFYMLVRAAAFGDEGEKAGGSRFPARITISRDDNGGLFVKEFWVPRDGAYYDDDIKAEFPEEYWDDALTMEGYKEALEEAVLSKITERLAEDNADDTGK